MTNDYRTLEQTASILGGKCRAYIVNSTDHKTDVCKSINELMNSYPKYRHYKVIGLIPMIDTSLSEYYWDSVFTEILIVKGAEYDTYQR